MTNSAQAFSVDHASYGKDGVRLLTRFPSDLGDRVSELTLSIRVEGQFLASYLSGDNSAVLPSDTLRRHALAERARNPTSDPLDFVEAIARRILDANPALTIVKVMADARRWTALGRHTLTASPWMETVQVSAGRDGHVDRQGGVTGVQLLTTTGSAFTGFMRDDLTVQAESSDRPLCGSLDATWVYGPARSTSDPMVESDTIDRLLAACTDKPSNAIQELLTAAARIVLEQTPELETISLRFAALPISTNVFDDPNARQQTYEIGGGPIGVTAVTLARGPDSVPPVPDTQGLASGPAALPRT